MDRRRGASPVPRKVADMFSAFCRRHGRRVLLPLSLIESLHNGPDGIEVHFRCTCGEAGVWRTGARGAAPAGVAA